ncbi:hypothetical protein OC842_003848 [Tilletia horrida]|uniref:Peptidase A1 domain-containing protein n=1 Tax=Tilletia horrida TaxID=155126 RepID=A0AAN6GC47_9BASI|nr:hypothetical protein OC842_003848 [Tilletia horrida]
MAPSSVLSLSTPSSSPRRRRRRRRRGAGAGAGAGAARAAGAGAARRTVATATLLFCLLAALHGAHAAPAPSLPGPSPPAGTAALEHFDVLIQRLQQERQHVRTRYLQEQQQQQQQQQQRQQQQQQEREARRRTAPIPPAQEKQRQRPQRRYGEPATTYVELGNQANTLLFAPATIGTPPRNFLHVLDTGSSDWWIITDIWGPDPHDPLLANQSIYQNISTLPPLDPPSTSFVSTNRTYGPSAAINGNVIRSGFQGTDIIRFANRRVDNATMNVVTSASNGAPNYPGMGVIGLGWDSLANGRAVPFWQATSSIFCLDLATSPNIANSYAYGGKLYLGPPPPPAPEQAPNATSPYVGNITYFPLLPSIQGETWTIALSELRVGNRSVPLSSSSSSSAAAEAPSAKVVFESSTSTIGAPDAVASAFYARIPQAEPVPLVPGFWWYPCNQSGGLPLPPAPGSGAPQLDVTLSFDADHHYTIPDGLFGFPTTVSASSSSGGGGGSGSSNVTSAARKRRRGEPGSMDASDVDSGATMSPEGDPTDQPLVRCIGALYGYGNLTTGGNNSTALAAANDAQITGRPGGELLIVGLPFLRSVFSVFDGLKPAVGFATPSDPPLSPSSLARGASSPSWLRAFQHQQPDRDGDGSPGPFESSSSGEGDGSGVGDGKGGKHSGAAPVAASASASSTSSCADP